MAALFVTDYTQCDSCLPGASCTLHHHRLIGTQKGIHSFPAIKAVTDAGGSIMAIIQRSAD